VDSGNGLIWLLAGAMHTGSELPMGGSVCVDIGNPTQWDYLIAHGAVEPSRLMRGMRITRIDDAEPPSLEIVETAEGRHLELFTSATKMRLFRDHLYVVHAGRKNREESFYVTKHYPREFHAVSRHFLSDCQRIADSVVVNMLLLRVSGDAECMDPTSYFRGGTYGEGSFV